MTVDDYSTTYLNGATDVLALREQLWDAGFRPISLYNWDDEAIPLKDRGKRPMGEDWRELALQDPPAAVRIPPHPRALNTGILCDGMRAVDVDIDSSTIAARVRSLAIAMLGEAPIRIRSQSARHLILYRAAEGQPRKIVLKGTYGKIEVLGAGQQFAAFGRHFTGADLSWTEPPGACCADTLPVVTEEQITDFLTACAPIINAEPPKTQQEAPEAGATSGAGQQAEFLRVAAALAEIPNDGPADWEHWNKIGMAIWAATGGSAGGGEAFAAWSARHPAYDPQATAERWQHYRTSPPTQIGAGTLFHLAQEARQNREPPKAEPEPDTRGTVHGGLKVLSVADIDTAKPRSYLLKGLLSPGELSLWVGPPKCGKSFLMLHVAYLLSLGLSVFSRRVKPTIVLYVAAEGEAGIANRIKALREKYGPSENFHFIAQPVDLLHPYGHQGDLIAAAQACGAQLIVLDTLSRMLAGGDENSPQDMGTFVRNVGEIRHVTDAHIAIVHHGTKASNGSSPRGHGSLTGADDALIEVVKQADGSRVATVVHAKDDADGMRFGFTLETVRLGTDEDGDPITTLRVEETGQPAGTSGQNGTGRLSDNLQIGLKTLKAAMQASQIIEPVGEHRIERLVVYESDWRAWFYRTCRPGESQDTKKKAFQRVVAGLLARGLIESWEDFVWTT